MKLISATSNLLSASLMASSHGNALTVLWFTTACMWFGAALSTALARLFVGGPESDEDE